MDPTPITNARVTALMNTAMVSNPIRAKATATTTVAAVGMTAMTTK